MATISLTFNGTVAALTELVDLNAQVYGYQETVDGQPNPEPKLEFVRKAIKDELLEQARSQKRKNAVAALPVSLVNGIT